LGVRLPDWTSMIRTIYVWHGDDADVTRLRKHGIHRVLFAGGGTPAARPEQIVAARNAGLQAGIYMNPQWYGFPDAREFRIRISEAVAKLAQGGPLPVEINNERHDGEYMLQIMFWYRRSFRTRETSWCPEGYQGGWIGPDVFRKTYEYTHPSLEAPVTLGSSLMAGVEICPQAYDGDMNDFDPVDVKDDLVAWGVPYQSVHPVMDAASIDAFPPSRRVRQHFYLQSRLP
jgi:hypothetical protein